MAYDGLHCLWATGFTPISSRDVSDFFSREAKVSMVVIPDVDSTACGIVVNGFDDVKKLLLLDGHSYRDDTLTIRIPTESQYAVIEDLGEVRKETESDVVKLADSLASLPQDQFARLLSLVEDKRIRKSTDIAMKTEDVLQDKHFVFSQPPTHERSIVDNGSTLRHHDVLPGNSPQFSVPYYNPCRIPVFSGDGVKGEVDYLHWRHEVESLMSEACPSSHLLPAIRKSLKGTAADVLLNMGVNISEGDILDKLDVIFGNVLSTEALFEEFYTARQEQEEGIASWACRLESLLAKASVSNASQDDTSRMLRSKFWGGLREERIKNGIRHRYDAGDSFTVLLRSARQIERETPAPPRKQSRVSVQSIDTDLSKKMDTLLQLVDSLGKRIDTIENKNQQRYRQGRLPPICFFCGEAGHIQRLCPHKPGNGR